MIDPAAKPVLRGERVLLRPIGPDDAPAVHASTLDPESMRLTGTRESFTLERIEAWCAGLPARDDRVDLAILDPSTGAFLGEVVLNDLDPTDRSANFRIALAGERHFGRGYGTEAARLLLRWAFDTLDLHRVALEVYAFNARALRMYERLGFREEGRLREAFFQDGAFHDVVVMGMLAGELRE